MLKEDYIPGGFTREVLEGYIQFYQFKHPFLFVDKAKGANVIKDIEAETIFTNGFAVKEELRDYKMEIDRLFDFERLSGLSDEQILFKVFSIKKRIFGKYFLSVLPEIRKKEIEKTSEYLNGISEMCEIFGCFFEKGDSFNFGRDFKNDVNRFIEELLYDISSREGRIFIFPGSYRHIPPLNRIMQECLPNIIDSRIKYMLKNNPIYDEPSECDVKSAFSKMPDICFFNSECYGTDLSDISLEKWNSELNEEDVVIFTGENMLLTSENSGFEYRVISDVVSDKAAKYTGKYPADGEIRHFFEKIPCLDYPFEKRFHGAERSSYSLNPRKWNDKRYFLNYYSETFDPDKFPEMDINGKSFEEIIFERDRVLSKIADEELNKMHGSYLDRYYDLENLDRIEYVPETERNAVLVRGIRFDSVDSVSVNPLIAQLYGKEFVDMRSVSKQPAFTADTHFMLNFLYFATGNIKNLYNSLRADRPLEKIDFENFYIDYYRCNLHEKWETVPLYNKAVIEYSGKTGNIGVMNKTLKSGYVDICGVKFAWDDEAVNSVVNVPVSVFTPQFITERTTADKFREYRKCVGENRFNIVIVDNRIVCVRKGDVVLPSLGVVLSLDSLEFGKLKSCLKLHESDNGYFTFERDKPVYFKGNNGRSEDSQNGCCWSFGGGFQLVENGVSLVENESAAKKAFEKEGWFNPLSMQTQETQVQEWVRGPRSVIGTTFGGGVFAATFSGRTKESKGACFDEIVRILRKEIADVKDVVNLDGGASSCLGMIYKGEFFELSYPSMTTFNSAGMVRPLNSVILFGSR